jgi:hypothetical protein
VNIKKPRRLCSEIVEEDDPETRIAVAACRMASVGGIGLLVQNSGVNRSSALCYGLKIKIVAFHFDQHEIPQQRFWRVLARGQEAYISSETSRLRPTPIWATMIVLSSGSTSHARNMTSCSRTPRSMSRSTLCAPIREPRPASQNRFAAIATVALPTIQGELLYRRLHYVLVGFDATHNTARAIHRSVGLRREEPAQLHLSG